MLEVKKSKGLDKRKYLYKVRSMNKNELAEKILNGLDKAAFADWYTVGRFDDYISGTYPKEDPRQPTKEQILADIIKMFRL